MRGLAENESWPYFLGLVLFLAVILNITHYAVLHMSLAIVSSVSAPEPEPFYASITPQGFLRIPVALYLAATAAFVEEAFCRGLPYLYLKGRYPDSFPRQGYIWGTAVVFSLLHWENGPHELAATFAFGLLAAALYIRLRDLWPLIGAHFVIDFAGFS